MNKKSENRKTEVQREINEEKEREVWGMRDIEAA